MSTATEVPGDHAPVHPTQHDVALEAASHDKQYWVIAAVLAVMTAVEVALSYLDIPDGVMIAGLLVLMVVKFALVILFFMHLKYDSKLFGRLFYTGIAFTVGVYLVALATFHFFASN